MPDLWRHSESSRHFRNEPGVDFDAESPSNFAKTRPGVFWGGDKELVRVSQDGSVTFTPGCYVDDVVAFCHGAIASNPTIAPEIKTHLARFIDAMDARAMARHGYSNSKTEQEMTWKALA